jgi:hypothetical protein
MQKAFLKMHKVIVGFLILTFCCVVSAQSPVKGGTLSLRYDEGLGLRVFANEMLSFHVSGFYWLETPERDSLQPLNTVGFKGGVAVNLYSTKKFRLPIFLEYLGEMHQGQIDVRNDGDKNYKRYNIWDHTGRLGLAPEVFFTEHFSLTYKFGVQLTYFGKEFIANREQSGLASDENDQDHVEVGVYGLGADFGSFLAGLVFNVNF